MKKFTYLLFLALGVTACSVESIDSTENLLTADFSFNDSDFEVVTHDYRNSQGVLRGTLSVSQDCNNLYVAISGTPSEFHLGIYNENANPPLKQNGDISHGSLPDNLNTATNYEWVFPLASFTSTKIKIFARGWGGEWAGDNEFADGSYLEYNLSNCETVCAYGKGYWKNHGPNNPGGQDNMYPVDQLTIAGTNYTQEQLQAFLDATGNIGDVARMKQHLIAVLLNIANGVDGTAIASTIQDAEAILNGNINNLDVNVVKNALEAFNEENGCEDFDEQE